MKFDEFHKLVRLNGWIKLRQMGTSMSFTRRVDKHTLFRTTKGRD